MKKQLRRLPAGPFLQLAGQKPVFYFLFQAEDGIRDVAVTGVQTCALPIYIQESVRLREECVLLDLVGLIRSGNRIKVVRNEIQGDGRLMILVVEKVFKEVWIS